MIANHTSHLDGLCYRALPYWLCDCVFPVAAGDVFFDTPVTSLFSASILECLANGGKTAVLTPWPS